MNIESGKITIVGRDVTQEEVNRLGAFDGIRVSAQNTPGQDSLSLFLVQRRQTLSTLLSLFFLSFAFILSWLDAALPSVVLFALATVVGGWPTFKKGVIGLLRLKFTMNTLMSVAVVGAIGIGYWEEAAVVAFLFGVSETLEAYTLERARSSLRSLLELTPATATLKRHGGEVKIPVTDIQVGDILIIRPGEKVAMDGVIVRGRTSLNQAAITGESLPVEKTMGDGVFAGSLNMDGYVEVKATKVFADNTISKIIDMVEEAQEKRAPAQSFVDQFASYYTPAVLVVAAGIVLLSPLIPGLNLHSAIYNALALLIIACPCALVVSTPVAIVSAIGNAAKNGVLIKGGLHLENAGRLVAIAFDKTGTLTLGTPKVTDIIPLKGGEKEDILAIAAGIEKLSEHPLGTAIYKEALKHKIVVVEAEEFRSHVGRGATGRINGKDYFIGSPRLFVEKGFLLKKVEPLIKALEGEGKSAVLLGNQDEMVAIIAVADALRNSSRAALSQVKKLGIKKTIMLTGDNKTTAEAIAVQTGIDEYRFNLLPGDKAQAVEELLARYRHIAMVGDGINDAPALGLATTGIAMGGAGTDTALETADIVLMADDLSKLPFTIRLGKASLRIIKQNITFAIGIKLLALLLIIPGWLTLWMAIAADMGATLAVTLNGIRLLKLKH